MIQWAHLISPDLKTKQGLAWLEFGWETACNTRCCKGPDILQAKAKNELV